MLVPVSFPIIKYNSEKFPFFKDTSPDRGISFPPYYIQEKAAAKKLKIKLLFVANKQFKFSRVFLLLLLIYEMR